jgi:hypothetical protein
MAKFTGPHSPDCASQTVGDSKKITWRPPARHQWFDPWKTATGANLKTLVDRTVASVRHHEEHTKARARARREVDERHHIRRIEAVICNLAHAVLLTPPTGRIATKLGKSNKVRSRYESPLLGKPFSPLIWMLDELGFLDLKLIPVPRGEVSSIAPSPWFVGKVREAGVQLADFGRDDTEEVVLLSRNSREETPWWEETGSRKVYREPIDYSDTPETERYRDAIRHLNRSLSGADIDFLDDGLEPRIDPFDRTLRRRFVLRPGQDPRFDQSGRLYGGFWQNLKTARRKHIRIKGEPVVVLDFASMFTRLAYAQLGATPPAGDLYAIPGLEGYRSGVKRAMNCFLFDGGTRRSWPDTFGIGVGNDDDACADPNGVAASFEARLPAGWGVARTKEAIIRVHPALKNAWGRGLGYGLMFTESQVLVAILQDLAARNIPALGLHDGLLVGVSDREVAREVMRRAAKAVAGIELPVSEK